MTVQLVLVLAACSTDSGDDDQVSSVTHEVTGCTGTGFSVFEQLCGVGESGGRPAVSFRGQWFRLDYDGTTWTVTNSVAAAESAVAPTDTAIDSRPTCRGYCQSVCAAGPIESDPECTQQRVDCINECNTHYRIRESRKFVWSVAGQTFNLEGTQLVENQRTQNGGEDFRIGRNLTLTMTTNDPADGNPWTVAAHPVRAKTDATDQVQANWVATEPSATTTFGDYNDLFPDSQINVQFTSQVEVMSAVKTGVPGASAMAARSNLAMNRALDSNMPQGSFYQSHFEPEALNLSGNVLSRLPDSGGVGAYDLNRFSQFFMNDRRGHAGFSSAGSGERPFAQSTKREWKFHQNIRDYSVNFPFLAGICGFEVWVRSYIAGAFSLGNRSCFDGVPVDVNMSGFLELALRGGGGLGCNIFVASAYAGLSAGIRARTEFSTSIDATSVPPALTASVNLYSDVDYAAYFRVRVLFWTKKWEKTIGVFGRRTLFQKGASFRLASSQAVSYKQLCTLSGTPADVGTCSDPEATCDIEGRCVRYDLASTGQPERVEVEQCTLPACSTDQPLHADHLVDPFLPSFASCAPKCGDVPAGLVNPDGSVCPGTSCNGLPGGFNQSLLTIPSDALIEILTSSDNGQRARVYTWTAGGTKKAVIEISGVTTGAGYMIDLKNCIDNFVNNRPSPTAQRVNDKIRQLKAAGYAHNNIMIRGHSLGSLDAYQVMDMGAPSNGAGAGHGIMLGVPLHAIIRINQDVWGRLRNPQPNSQIGIFVSPTDPVARGVPTPKAAGQYVDVWCKAKKGPGPGFNQKLPSNLLFNVVNTPGDSIYPEVFGDLFQGFGGHFISSYCQVAPVTCFQGDNLLRKTRVTLQANTGHYLSPRDRDVFGTGGWVHADVSAAGPREHFIVESIGPLRDGSRIYVRTWNDQFFSHLRREFLPDVLSGTHHARATASEFTVVREAGRGEVRSGDKISLRSVVNGKFVAARDGGGSYHEINRGTAGPWEKFLISFRFNNLPTQSNWRWCSKCQGLAYGVPWSVCPAGGAHSTAGSSDYSLHIDVGAQPGLQDNWRWCSKCMGLAYGVPWSVCPAGGSHNMAGNYSLHLNAAPQPGLEDNWRWCSKCMGLVYERAGSVCPAGGSHNMAGNYSLPRL